jgi:hypothetical protein
MKRKSPPLSLLGNKRVTKQPFFAISAGFVVSKIGIIF